VRALDPAVWQRLSAGAGIQGARLHDWAYCELTDLDAAEYDGDGACQGHAAGAGPTHAQQMD
jgi:SRSO17 transposase